MPAIALEQTPKSVPVPLPNSSRVVAEMPPADYHAFLRTAHDRYEYIDGKVIRMPGASPEHNRISKNFIVAIDVALVQANSDCDIFGGDQKIYICPHRFYLADAVVVCGNEQFDFDDCLRNPVLVMEVLSPSTASFDQEDKFRDYRSIESLTDYVLIRQDCPAVTHYRKGNNSLWTIVGDHTELSHVLELRLGTTTIAVPIALFYRRIDFPALTSTGTVQESPSE